MPIETECPLCGHKGNVPDKFDGKQVKCPECCNLFIAAGAAAPAAAGAMAKTGGSHAGQMKISVPGGSHAGTMKSPTSGSQAGQMKLTPSNGSAAGQQKIKPAAPTQQGTKKNLSAGSHAGQAKLSPSNGSGQGNQKIKPTNGSAQGTQKIKPANGSGQGTQKIKPTGKSAQGNLKKPPPSPPTQKKPAAKGRAGSGDPFTSFNYDDDKGQQQLRRKRRSRKAGNFVALLAFLLFFGAFIAGAVFVGMHFHGGGTIPQLWAKVGGLFSPAKPEEKSDETAPEVKPTAVAETQPDQPVEKKVEPPVVADAFKGAVIKNVLVRVESVAYAVPPVKDLEKKDKALIVRLKIDNKSADAVNFQGWGTPEAINKDHPPVLADESGKLYNRVDFGPGVTADGMVLAETIQPGKGLSDLVVFETPPGNSPFVKLQLSADNLGLGEGSIHLLIPAAALGKAGVPLPKDDKVVVKPDMKPEPAKEPAQVQILKASLISKLAPSRLDAVTGLADLGPMAASAVPDLLPLLEKDESENVRATVAEVLPRFGKAAKKAVPALLTALKKDEFWKVRAESAKSLVKLADADNKAEILMALNDQKGKEKDEQALTAIGNAIKNLDKMEKK